MAKTITLTASLLFSIVFLSGCATKTLQVKASPGVKQIIQRGTYAGRSNKKGSTCLLSANFHVREPGYVVFHIGIRNDSNGEMLIKPENLKYFVKKDGGWREGRVYSPKEWKRHLGANEFWTGFSAGLNAASASMNAGQSSTTGYSSYTSYGSATAYGPSGVTNVYGTANTYGNSYSTTYDADKAAQTRMKANAQAQEIVRREVESNEIIRGQLLEPHTLPPDNIYEGNIYARKHSFDEIRIEFTVSEDKHVFYIELGE